MGSQTAPNFLFLFPDQLRRDFLSCYGATFIDTPNIDWIAENGVRYDNAYSASPLCVPARTALLTGMNAVRNGVTDNLHALRPDYARAGIRTWPQILAASGYYTAAVGKMHFYPWDARHGFQYRVVCEDKLWSLIRDDYYHYLKDHGLRKLRWQEYGEYLERKGVAHTDVPWEHSWDRYTGREARRFIDAHGNDGPFALMVGFPGPHDPYDPADDFPHTYRAQDMPAPITGVGFPRRHAARGKGSLTRGHGNGPDELYRGRDAGREGPLRRAGKTDRPRGRRDNRRAAAQRASGQHGHRFRHRPRRSPGRPRNRGQGDLLRVRGSHPAAGARPGQDGQGAACQDLVELRDVTATMLALAGCALPDYMDAQPLPALGLEGPSPRDHLFGYLTQSWMAFDGRYKLAKYSGHGGSGEAHLFDLQADPHEQDNLLASPGAEVNAVYRRLDAALTGELMSSMAFSMHDRLPMPYSMSGDEHEAREGWIWPYPSPASAAVRVEDPY